MAAQPFAVALLPLLVVLAGCSGPASSTDVHEEFEVSGEAAPASAPEEAPPGDTPPPPARFFPPQEYDLQVTYGVAGPGTQQGDSKEMMRQADVPATANQLAVEVTWTPRVPTAARQQCMVHLGTLAEIGDMIAGKSGTSPLRLEGVNVPPENETVVVMCFVRGDPVAAEVLQSIHLKLEFAWIPPPAAQA